MKNFIARSVQHNFCYAESALLARFQLRQKLKFNPFFMKSYIIFSTNIGIVFYPYKDIPKYIISRFAPEVTQFPAPFWNAR